MCDGFGIDVSHVDRVEEFEDIDFYRREPSDNDYPFFYSEQMISYREFDLSSYAPEGGVHLEPAGVAGQFEYIYIKCWEFRGPSVLHKYYDGLAHEKALGREVRGNRWLLWRDNPEPCHWRPVKLYPTPGVAVQLPWDFVIEGRSSIRYQERVATSFSKQCHHLDPCQALLYKLARALLLCRQLPCPRNQCGWYRALAVNLLRLSEESGYNRGYVHLDMLEQAQR